MGKFEDWFNNKLKAVQYPKISDFETIYKNIDYLINVSDEYKPEIHDICLSKNIKYFYFPLNECTDNMGLNSIYGAMQIMFIAEQENKKVIINCHAGSNRSVTILECYYYLRTKKYTVTKKIDKKLALDIESMFTFESEEDRLESRRISGNSRLQNNIEFGHLPAKHKMEQFLKECEKHFQKNTSLDSIKLKTFTQSY